MVSRFFAIIGSKVLYFLTELGQVKILLIGIIKSLRFLKKNKRNVLYQMEHIGIGSLPLVLIIAAFTGAVAV